jgi:hypothetical protein
MSRTRIRLTSLSITLAGVLFLLYEAIRPYSDESTLSGAAAFGSTAWVISHSFAIAAFVLLVLGLLGVYLALTETSSESWALIGLVLSWVGIGLTLPFYGAEVFALHAIGQAALQQNDASLVSLAASVRGEPGIWFIVTGLSVLEVGIVAVAIAIWRSRRLTRWIGVPLAISFAFFLPQFSAPQWLRIVYGFLITLSCVLAAVDLSLRRRAVAHGPQGLS